MPKLIRLYIQNVVVGFGLSAAFVGLLLYTNVANLWHLVSSSDMGWVAAIMLFIFNGIIFAGVQFAIVIMRLEHKPEGPKGGKRQPVITGEPARVRVTAGR